MSEFLEGNKLTSARTLKSRYDNDSIAVCDGDGKSYRIKAEDILKYLRKGAFALRKKKVHTYLVPLCLVLMLGSFTPKAEASTIVETAQSFIGKGEEGGDNQGQWVYRFLNEDPAKLPWCAGFVSYVLQETGRYDYLPYIRRAKEFLKYGEHVSNPQPGDLIVFWRGTPSARSGHVGIVERVTGDYIYTIEGNTGKYPSKVKRLRYPRADIPRFLAFVRLRVQ